MMVADGMGGQGGGDLASRVAVQAVTNYVCHVMPWLTAESIALEPGRPSSDSLPGVRNALGHALDIGDTTVRGQHHAPGGVEGMGTTLTLAYVIWPRLYIAHAGDSAAYLLRDGKLARLTTPHTLAQQLIERGAETSSRWHHVLWNALGGSSRVQPEVWSASLTRTDQLVLCSDGLTKHVEEDTIAAVVENEPTAECACDRLVVLANEAGGTDNVTAIVARFG